MAGGVIDVLPVRCRLPRLAQNPLPNLHGFVSVGIDDKMLIGGLGHLLFKLAAGGIVGDVAIIIGSAFEDLNPSLFGESMQ